MANKQDTMKDAIYKHFRGKMSERIKGLIHAANDDLYFGPITECNACGAKYTGFSSAVDEIHSWCQDNIHEVWYDSDCGEILDKEPEMTATCCSCDGNGCLECGNCGIMDVYNEFVHHFDVLHIKRIVFGKELAQYV